MFNRPICLTIVLGLVAATSAQLPPLPKTGGTKAAPKPKLFVPQRIMDLGTMLEGDKAEVAWILENRGGAPLVISETKSTCGCTVLQVAEDKRTIAPGKSLTLKAIFDSQAKHDSETSTVHVYSNDPAEPDLTLTIKADVKTLFNMTPGGGVLPLMTIPRGSVVGRTLDFFTDSNQPPVKITGVEIPNDKPIAYRVERFEDKNRRLIGERVVFTIKEDAPLGILTAKAIVTLEVADHERKREVTLTGRVVGEITYTPELLDTTRKKSRRGQKLAPIYITSSNAKITFDVLEATAGPLFDVVIEPSPRKPKGTEYVARLTIRGDAPSGPFGAALVVRTSSLDQPMVTVPIFGNIAPVISVEPPIVLLRQDGKAIGTKRMLKLQGPVREILKVVGFSCDSAAVTAVVSKERGTRYRHIRYIEVELTGKVPKGTHQATLIISTSIKGAEKLEIPVTIIGM